MNLDLKAVYVCVSSRGKWGKGLNPFEAIKNAGLRPNAKMQHFVQAAVFNNPTDEELDNLYTCVIVNHYGSPNFYDFNRDDSEESKRDKEMIQRLLVGWMTVFSNVPKD